MHIQHNNNSTFATIEHVVDLHLSSSMNDTAHDASHQAGTQDNHSVKIDAGIGSYVNKAGASNLIVFLFIVISFILFALRLIRYRNDRDAEADLPPNFYLFNPPLRAPPL